METNLGREYRRNVGMMLSKVCYTLHRVSGITLQEIADALNDELQDSKTKSHPSKIRGWVERHHLPDASAARAALIILVRRYGRRLMALDVALDPELKKALIFALLEDDEVLLDEAFERLKDEIDKRGITPE